jgi:hypothetical protein
VLVGRDPGLTVPIQSSEVMAYFSTLLWYPPFATPGRALAPSLYAFDAVGRDVLVPGTAIGARWFDDEAGVGWLILVEVPDEDVAGLAVTAPASVRLLRPA